MLPPLMILNYFNANSHSAVLQIITNSSTQKYMGGFDTRYPIVEIPHQM